MITAENIRFHAAGHLAAAHALTEMQELVAARFLLKIVKAFAESPRVSSPPAVMELIDKAIEAPQDALAVIALLEEWFCDPFNTTLEKSGATFK